MNRTIPVLAVLHIADLMRDQKMKLPAVRDWQKVRAFHEGRWPHPLPQYLATTSAVEAAAALATAPTAGPLVIDTEFDPSSRYLLLVGVGWPGARQVVQFVHRAAEWHERQHFGSLLRAKVRTTPVVFQNSFADIPVLQQAYGIEYGDYCRIDDTMLAHAVLWSDWPHTLEFLASIYGQHPKMKHLAHSNPELYNTGDVVDTLSVWQGLEYEFKADRASQRVYETQSLGLVPILLKSMAHGIRTNQPLIEELTPKYEARFTWATAIGQAYTGWRFNLGSDQQLRRQLYDIEGLPVQTKKVKGKKGKQVTVDGDAIATLRQSILPYDPDFEEREGIDLDYVIHRLEAGGHPLLEARVVHTDAGQLLSYYFRPMRGKERVYPNFAIHAQASGRWSTIDPPLATLPRALRGLVIPDEGERWISFDWSQVEPRLLAALAKDEPYLEAFANNWDVYTLEACHIFGYALPPLKTKALHTHPECHEWRQRYNWLGEGDIRRHFTKRFVLRLHYGGKPALAGDIPGARQLNLTPTRLVEAARLYSAAHPAIKRYWDASKAQCLASREVRAFDGRRRRLLSESVQANERLIYNHPMQGGVSGIANVTVIKIAHALPDARFVMQMHDSQKWAAPEHQYESALATIKAILHEPWNIGGVMVTFPATFEDDH